MSEPTKEEKGGEANDAGSASVLDILANAADAKEKVSDDAVEDKVEDASASKADDDKGKEEDEVIKKDDDTTKQPTPADTAAAAPGPAAASHEQPPYENPPTIPAMQQQAFAHHATQYGNNMANNPQAYNPAMMMNNYPQTKAPTTHNLPQTGVRNDVPMPFPEKLMELLSNEDVSDVITWLPHGKGFAILKKNKFAAEVMPMYFKQSKYTSFTRKLKRWGFTRVTTGAEQGAYYHKFFQRGNHLLCMQMQCQSSTPLKFDHNLHEQNKLLHEEKIAAQQQKMGGRATYDQNEGNRLSLLAQEDAATSGIPTMIPPKPVAIHLPNSQKRVAATSNVDLDEAIRHQKAMLEADEARLLGNNFDTQQALLRQQLLQGSMGAGSGFDPVFERQQQLLRSTMDESEKKKAEEMLMFERTRQQAQQMLMMGASSMPQYVPPPNNYPNNNVMPSSMSMNMMAANNGYNQYNTSEGGEGGGGGGGGGGGQPQSQQMSRSEMEYFQMMSAMMQQQKQQGGGSGPM